MRIEKITAGKDNLQYITIRDLPKEGYIILTLPIYGINLHLTNTHIHIRNRDSEGDFI